MKFRIAACSISLVAMLGPALANDVAFERMEKTITINADGTNEQVQITTVRLLTEQGAKGAGQIPIPYSESRHSLTIDEAYTIRPDGTKLPVPMEKIFTQGTPVAINAPMFNDMKYRIIVFPDPELGGKIHFKTTLRETTPNFPGHFTQIESVTPPFPIDTMILRVSAPSSMKLRVSARGIDVGNVPVSEKIPGRDQWEWKFSSIAPDRPEPFQLTGMDVGHHIVISSFENWGALAAAYQSRAASKVRVTPAIQSLADELTKGLDDPKEQARALAHWTARNIRYVGIFLGLGGFVPREASEILATKYGDCKDHTVILEALLKAKGIDSQPALVNIGSTFKMPEIPTVGAFNHVITYLPKLDMYVDATANFNRFGTLPIQVSGKTVLLTGSGRLATTPRNTSEANKVHARVTLRILPSGDVFGKSFISTEGSFESNLRQRIAGTPGAQKESLITALLGNDQRGGGTYLNTEPNDLDKPLTFSTNFNLMGAVDIQSPGAFRIPTGISVSNIHQTLNPGSVTGLRRTPFQCTSDTRTEDYEIELPADIKVAALPRDISHKTATITFEAKYRQEGRKIFVERKLIRERGKEHCEADMWSEVLAAHAVLARDSRAQVILQ